MATALLLALGLAVAYALPGLSLVLRASGEQEGWAGWLARWGTGPFDVAEVEVPSRHGPLRARVYRPSKPSARSRVLTSGVHADGIDEPRLVKLAGDLAAGGHVVVTPEPPDLLRYHITPRTPDMVEDAALWVASQPALAPEGTVGLVGISFSGGLSVVAAGRPTSPRWGASSPPGPPSSVSSLPQVPPPCFPAHTHPLSTFRY